MLLNQSVLFDGAAAAMHDRYRDMRLDVDNMSYEVKEKPQWTINLCWAVLNRENLTPLVHKL